MEHQIIEFLSQPTLGGVGLILTVVFGITSLVLYEKQKQGKAIWFYVTVFNISPFPINNDNLSEGADTQIPSKPLGTETIYEVTIWNRGKSTIEGSAISPADPLVLTAGENHSILSSSLVSESRKAVSASAVVDKDKKCVSINFKFLDWKDGMKIVLTVARANPEKSRKMRYTGVLLRGIEREHRAPGVQLSGTVMGVNQIQRLRTIPFSVPITISIVMACVVICLAIGLVFSLSYVFSFPIGISLAGRYAAPALVFFLGAAFLWATVWLWHFRFLPSENNWFRHERFSEAFRSHMRARRLVEAEPDLEP
jgi:hypothetical protein